MLARRRRPPAAQRLAELEDGRRARPLVLIIRPPLRMLRRRRQRPLRFPIQLHRLLVPAHHRLLPILRLGIGFQRFFHRRDEFRVLLRRNHPVLQLVPRDAVFFSVCRAVSWLMEATMPNSTTRRVSSRSDQFP